MLAFCLLGLLSGLSTASPWVKRSTGYSSGSTASDIENGICAPLTVVFARGTGESGNIGTIVGPPLFQALISKTAGNVALQGVNYPADVDGIYQGGSAGGTAMKAIVEQGLSQCPSTKIALAGYSQGGQAVHYALNNVDLDSSVVAAIVYFGDPGYCCSASGSVDPSKIKQYCATGDDVCEQAKFSITPAHLSYGANATDAAQFIIDTTGVATTASSSPSTTVPVSSTTTSTATSNIFCTLFKLFC